MDDSQTRRRDAVAELKRSIILRAALRVFQDNGLDGSSVRAIAKRAGYTPGAIYAYFPSKEHIYAAVLSESLHRLRHAVNEAAERAGSAAVDRFVAAGLGFFDFYHAHPKDLDLGFYLFRGGMRPRGLSTELDQELNDQLLAALEPVRRAVLDHSGTASDASLLVADVFAHASGLLLLAHTKRLTLFEGSARDLMRLHLTRLASGLPGLSDTRRQ